MSIIYHRTSLGVVVKPSFRVKCHQNEKTKWPPKYEAVTQIVGVSASTSRQLDPKSPLLLYPRDITNIAVSNTLKKTIAIYHSDDPSVSSDEERPKLTPDATPPEEIFHTALQLWADLKDSPGDDTSVRGIAWYRYTFRYNGKHLLCSRSYCWNWYIL